MALTEHQQQGVAKIKALMAEYKLQLRDLSDTPLYRSTAPARYADSAGNTWTGQGRRPHWIKRIEAAGLDIEAYRVR